jgi:Replication factor RFC1 C terminal domain
MDRYFKGPKQKTENFLTKLGRVVAVVGRPGIGKTWTVHQTLELRIEITAEILRSKQDTIQFLERIRSSPLPVVLDDYEAVQDLVGLREIKGPPTSGVFVIISHTEPKLDFEFATYEFPVPTPEKLREIAPGAPDWLIETAKGDIRWVLQNLEFKSDFRDDFYTTKEFVMNLVGAGQEGRASDFIGHSISEPGNVSAILNANYVDAPKDRIDMAAIASYFSEADVFEDRVYSGDWALFPYWNFFGCILPASAIGHTLKGPLKPGSTWTKYQNMCMRIKKIHTMATHVPGKKLCYDELLALRVQAENENVETLKEYGFTSQDIDVLNHLNPLRKLKPKTVSYLKKCLSQTKTPNG